MKFSRTISLLVIGLIFTPLAFGFAPQKAHAQTLSFDPVDFIYDIFGYVNDLGTQLLAGSDNTKEYVLDPIARVAATDALQSVAQSMINWAANGFDGSPAFVTDLQNNFLRIGDTVATNFQQELASGSVSSPFTADIAPAVIDKYYRETGRERYSIRARYTLDVGCSDPRAVLDVCGISGWMSAWTNPANNIYGAQILAEDELSSRITTATNDFLTESGWADGFLAWKSCPEGVTPPTGSGVELAEKESKLGCKTETPGSVVKYAIEESSIGTGLGLQVSADEIDEVIGNFFTQLVTDTIFGDGGGIAKGGQYQRIEPPRPSASVVSSFIANLDNQRPTLEQFRSGWSNIYSAALQAEAKLNTCSSTEADDLRVNEVAPLIVRAQNNIERVGAALAKFSDLARRAQAAAQGEGDFQAVVADFDAMRQNGELPTIPEYSEAVEQTRDISPPAPQTLMRKMNDIARASCYSYGNSDGNN